MSIKKGNITIASGDVTTNWGGINGDISNQQDLKNVLSSKADVNSPVFYGIPIVPTPEEGTDNLQIANTKFVQNEISKFDALPDQTNNSGKVLSTDGLNPIWVNQSSSNDGKSITLNDNGEIQASGIVNSNNPTEVVTMWIGTKDEYNALPSHSDTCIYNITDDTDSVDVYTKEEVYNKSETYNKNEVYNKNETYSKLETYNKNEIYNKSEINEISKNHLSTNQITNCITEIPQDINLELVDGTLTLKAGSKVYIPNGFEADGVTPKFDEVVIESDISLGSWGSATGEVLIGLDSSNSSYAWGIPSTAWYSGNTAPTFSETITVANWYDTANNIIKSTTNSGSSWDSSRGLSLPFALCTRTSGTLTSIDQVFNGFGYIGSTVFALPGVRGLSPNGRNTDGSLKNTEFTIPNVVTRTFSSSDNFKYAGFGINALTFEFGRDNIYVIMYNKEENYIYDGSNVWWNLCVCGSFTLTNGVISNFRPYSTLQVIDRNDTSWLSGLGMPSDKYIDLTLGASGSKYTAPANGWFSFECGFTAAFNSWASLGYTNYQIRDSRNGTTAGTSSHTLFIPVSKGRECYLTYGNLNSSHSTNLRFIYAEGEN